MCDADMDIQFTREYRPGVRWLGCGVVMNTDEGDEFDWLRIQSLTFSFILSTPLCSFTTNLPVNIIFTT